MHAHGMLLLIDDEPGFIGALAQLLRRDGYTVDTADTGPRGLELLRAQPYDVILCDLYLPALDGPALYDILQQQAPSLLQRVIFVTGGY